MEEERQLLADSSDEEEERGVYGSEDSSDSSESSEEDLFKELSEDDRKNVEEWKREKERQAKEEERRWAQFEREEREMAARDREWRAYWKRRHEDDRDLWRDKKQLKRVLVVVGGRTARTFDVFKFRKKVRFQDFANAVDKMSRAGYKGPHGNFDVPEMDNIAMEALFMQVTIGDYDGNRRLRCAKEWKKLKGKGRIEGQRDFIKKANELLTKYGWNPPDGWN